MSDYNREPDPERRALGQWCAAAEHAPDYDAYLAILDQVPQHWKDAVIRHCQTAAALGQQARERREQKARSRARLGLPDA